MTSKTDLKIKYAQLSWDYEFDAFIETALEADFIKHHKQYDENSMRRVAALLLIDHNPETDTLLECARGQITANT